MELKLFGFIEEVLEQLEEMRPMLEEVGSDIEGFFEDLLVRTNAGYLNINTRVKSQKSLKEKIIRNQYYQKYDTKEILFENVPDIIGIRLECRFIQDETDLYKFIKRSFGEKSEVYEGFFYNNTHEKILLNLADKQPQEQKNGMKIYRIDGKYVDEDQVINFELQVKSLVNIFWGEIEHKVIYKNYNYVIADKFYKDIMKSIKNSLTTIDQQLLLISNQFDQSDEKTYERQEKQLEAVLSKLIYDIFAKHMKETLGVLVDFKSSCEAVVRYVFRDALENSVNDYGEHLLSGFQKVRGIEEKLIDFTQEIFFEGQIRYEDEHTEHIGEHIKKRINEEFQWNLFFRILFAIEPENNRGDFETFVHYYTGKIYDKLIINKLNMNFTTEETKNIIETLMMQFSNCFVQINSVELLYDNMIDQVIKHMNSVIEALYKNVWTYEQWEKEKDIYTELLEMKLLMMFNIEVDYNKALGLLDRIRQTKSNIEVPKGMIKYVYKI